MKKALNYSMILAKSLNNGIGLKGDLPWHIPGDLKYFEAVSKTVPTFQTGWVPANLAFKPKLQSFPSKQNIVVMGRATWDSIPGKYLPGRINFVLSRQRKPSTPNTRFVTTIEEFFSEAAKLDYHRIFVVGGSYIYSDFVNQYPDQCDAIFCTNIQKEYECDSFFPLPKGFSPIYLSKARAFKGVPYDYRIYCRDEVKDQELTPAKLFSLVDGCHLERPQNEEMQYLNILRDVLETGTQKDDRTGTGVISKFGYRMEFDCGSTFPLITTKKTFLRGIVEELIWFLKGKTDSKYLSSKGVHIWDGNSTKEFLESRGLGHRQEGDVGPVYGFQWRHFGAEYTDCNADYSGKGVDQLKDIINTIKTNPTSRRLILSAWNPSDLPKMALPPCHILSQFNVANGKLDLQMYQRSADLGLGVPFNIASYALLLRVIAQLTGLKTGKLVHILGDAHIYSNHVDQLKKQLSRTPYAFPTLKLDSLSSLEDLSFDKITLRHYQCHTAIKMPMAI